jgi:hypothetical protein
MKFTSPLPKTSKSTLLVNGNPSQSTLQYALAAIALCGCFLGALPAQAQTPTPAPAPVVLRPEVLKPLQAAQEALKAGQFDNAVAMAQQALALPGITATEKPIIQRTLAVAAMQSKNFPLAISTLET